MPVPAHLGQHVTAENGDRRDLPVASGRYLWCWRTDKTQLLFPLFNLPGGCLHHLFDLRKEKSESAFFFPLTRRRGGVLSTLLQLQMHASQLSENRTVSNCSNQQPPAAEKESNSGGTLYRDHLLQLTRREHLNFPRSEASQYR